MNLNLPNIILEILKKRGAIADENLRSSKSNLEQVCKKYGYHFYESLDAFDGHFGGLMIPDEGQKLKKEEPHWLFGANACLTSDWHQDNKGKKAKKLVPVVYSPNDVIYYLDEQGKAYAEDTIEDTKPSFYADNGVSLVCRILLNDILFSRDETTLTLKGLQGNSLRENYGLSLVSEASGNDLCFSCDSNCEILVVEEIKTKQTRIACASTKQFNLVKKALGISTAPSAELAPFWGKTSVRIVGEKDPSLPDFFDQLPNLQELDISINKLKTLPESIWKATQLVSLDISFNAFTVLPDGIGNLKALRSLFLRGCPIQTLPDAIVGAKNLTKLIITECEKLDVDKALHVIAKLPKLKELSLPLSTSLTSLAPIAALPIKSLYLSGASVKHPQKLPAGLGSLKKLNDLSIKYADDIAQLPEAQEDVNALRLLFSKRFTDEDIRQSVLKQPSVLYLKAFVERVLR